MSVSHKKVGKEEEKVGWVARPETKEMGFRLFFFHSCKGRSTNFPRVKGGGGGRKENPFKTTQTTKIYLRRLGGERGGEKSGVPPPSTPEIYGRKRRKNGANTHMDGGGALFKSTQVPFIPNKISK